MLWWTEELKTGIESIDNEHKKIFDKAEEIMMFDDNTPINKIHETFDFLTNYVIDHFGKEEMTMIKCFYPHFEDHRHKHTSLIVNLHKLSKRLNDEGLTDRLIDDIKLLIVKWLVNHIDNDDKKFASFYRNGK